MTPIKGHYGTVTCHISPYAEDQFLLELDSEYCRFGLADGGGYSFIDPSGGPFISVGSLLNCYHRDLPAREIKSLSKLEEGGFVIQL